MPTMMIRLLFILLFTLSLYAQTVPYRLEFRVNKQEIYLGETLHATLRFEYGDLEDYELDEIKIPNFTVEELGSSDNRLDNGNAVEQIEYRLTPLKSGHFRLGSFKVAIEKLTKNYKHLNNKSKYIKKFSLTSNSSKVEIKKLPDNLSVIGEYTLLAEVDKKKVKKGERVTLTLKLQGVGNIKNLEFIQLKIPNTISYLLMSSKNSKKHLYTKTFEILADASYTIPSFELEYFDKELAIKRVAQTEAIAIEINKMTQNPALFSHTLNVKEKMFFILIGVLSTLLSLLLFILIKKISKKKSHNPLLSSLKRTKTSNIFYKKIVIYLGRDAELDALIFKFENRDAINFKKIKKVTIEKIKNLYLGEP